MTDEEILAILAPYWDDNPGKWPWPPRKNYYEHYARWATHATSLLEIGVMYGWSAMAMALGSGRMYDMVLIDSEFYGIPIDEAVRRVTQFCRDQNLPHARIEGLKLDTTQCSKLPWTSLFDVIHIDGQHSEAAVYNDMRLCLPLLGTGVMIIDDLKLPGIKPGADRFLGEHPELVAELHQDHQDHYLIRRR